MRAVSLDQTGAPEVLGVTEIEVPVPAEGEVLIRVAASAVNPVDIATRDGLIPSTLPAVLGWDVSGTVEAVGAGVTSFTPGQRVVGMSAQLATGRGTAAEFVALPDVLLAAAPTSMDLVAAAALPLAGLTARQTVAALGAPPADDPDLLVLGAQGSVGGLLTQLALHAGWQVSCLVREPGSLAADGVHRVYAEDDRPAPGSVPLVVDTGGIPDAVEVVRGGGRWVSITPFSLPEAERGVTVEVIGVEQDGPGLAGLVELVDTGALRLPAPAAVLPFAEAPRAHRLVEAGGLRGKVLLVPDPIR